MTIKEARDVLQEQIDKYWQEYDAEGIEALEIAIKILEQEPCDDCISRQAVIDGINEYFHDEYYQRTSIQDCGDCLIEDVIKKLPSVTPQPKTGHWEWVQYDYNPKLGNWHCSECRCVAVECVNKEEKGGIPLYKYCPQCGEKMESEEV